MPTTVTNFTLEIAWNLISPDGIGLVLDKLAAYEPVLLDEIATVVQQYQREAFAGEGALYEQPWAPLAPSTIAEKRHLGYTTRPMIRSGKLQAAVGQLVRIDQDGGVFVGVDTDEVPYAQYHQEGTSRMPRRVIVSFTAEEESALMKLIMEFVAERTGLPEWAVQVTHSTGAGS